MNSSASSLPMLRDNDSSVEVEPWDWNRYIRKPVAVDTFKIMVLTAALLYFDFRQLKLKTSSILN
jgi:hypothetical protein